MAKDNRFVIAVYVDNNISEGAREVQISDVQFTHNTYLNHESTLDVLVQSSYETQHEPQGRRGQ